MMSNANNKKNFNSIRHHIGRPVARGINSGRNSLPAIFLVLLIVAATFIAFAVSGVDGDKDGKKGKTSSSKVPSSTTATASSSSRHSAGGHSRREEKGKKRSSDTGSPTTSKDNNKRDRQSTVDTGQEYGRRGSVASTSEAKRQKATPPPSVGHGETASGKQGDYHGDRRQSIQSSGDNKKRRGDFWWNPFRIGGGGGGSDSRNKKGREKPHRSDTEREKLAAKRREQEKVAEKEAPLNGLSGVADPKLMAQLVVYEPPPPQTQSVQNESSRGRTPATVVDKERVKAQVLLPAWELVTNYDEDSDQSHIKLYNGSEWFEGELYQLTSALITYASHENDKGRYSKKAHRRTIYYLCGYLFVTTWYLRRADTGEETYWGDYLTKGRPGPRGEVSYEPPSTGLVLELSCSGPKNCILNTYYRIAGKWREMPDEGCDELEQQWATQQQTAGHHNTSTAFGASEVAPSGHPSGGGDNGDDNDDDSDDDSDESEEDDDDESEEKGGDHGGGQPSRLRTTITTESPEERLRRVNSERLQELKKLQKAMEQRKIQEEEDQRRAEKAAKLREQEEKAKAKAAAAEQRRLKEEAAELAELKEKEERAKRKAREAREAEAQAKAAARKEAEQKELRKKAHQRAMAAEEAERLRRKKEDELRRQEEEARVRLAELQQREEEELQKQREREEADEALNAQAKKIAALKKRQQELEKGNAEEAGHQPQYAAYMTSSPVLEAAGTTSDGDVDDGDDMEDVPHPQMGSETKSNLALLEEVLNSRNGIWIGNVQDLPKDFQKPPAGGSFLRGDERMLGKGAYGKVFVYKDGQPQGRECCAVKVIDRSKWQNQREWLEKNVHEEVMIMAELGLKGIEGVVHLYGYIASPLRDELLMPMAHGGSLGHLLTSAGALRPYDAAAMVAELAAIVNRVHRVGIVHADIKPINVFLKAGGGLLLGDFGMAVRMDDEERKYKSHGTVKFMAPEVTVCKGMSAKSDWWSVAVLAYSMVYAGLPFDWRGDPDISEKADKKEKLDRIYWKILYQKPYIPKKFENAPIYVNPIPVELDKLGGFNYNYVDPHFREFLRGLLNKKPRKRPGYKWIRDHEWLKGARKRGVPFLTKFEENTLGDNSRLLKGYELREWKDGKKGYYKLGESGAYEFVPLGYIPLKDPAKDPRVVNPRPKTPKEIAAEQAKRERASKRPPPPPGAFPPHYPNYTPQHFGQKQEPQEEWELEPIFPMEFGGGGGGGDFHPPAATATPPQYGGQWANTPFYNYSNNYDPIQKLRGRFESGPPASPPAVTNYRYDANPLAPRGQFP